MTDITKFKNVSLSKKTYSDVGVLSKAIFDVPLSLSKTIEYLVEKEIKKVNNGNGYIKIPYRLAREEQVAQCNVCSSQGEVDEEKLDSIIIDADGFHRLQ